MSFRDRLLRRTEPLDQIIGFNGGSLQGQIFDDDQLRAIGQNRGRPLNESGDINAPRVDLQQAALGQPSQPMPQQPSRFLQTQRPTMADKYMASAQPITEQPLPTEDRPRQVNPFQQRLMQGRPRVADPVGFGAEHLRELGTQKDPKWERILNATAAGIASAAQGGAPIKPIPTRREREMMRVEGQVGRDMAIEKQRMLRDQGQMVPFTLPDGTTTLVPAKTAGSLASRQQNQVANRNLSEQRLMKPVYRNDAQGRILKITPQPDGPDKVETASNVVKTKVPHTVWADGALKIWNPETGKYDNAKDTQDREITDELRVPVTVDINGKKFRVAPNTAAMATATGDRFNITEERAERGEQRADERDYRGRMAKAADLVGKIDGAKEAMRAANAKLIKNPRDADALEEMEGAKAYAIQAAKELNEGYGDLFEAGIGTEGTPYYKRKSVQPPPMTNTRRPSSRSGKGQRVSSQDLNKVLGLP